MSQENKDKAAGQPAASSRPCAPGNNAGRSGRSASFIKSFVSEVRVTGTEVLLAYNLPVSEGKLVSETCVVPPIVHYGGRYRTRTCDLLRVKQAL